MPLFPSVSKVGICACVVLLGCFIMAVDGTSCRILRETETLNATLDECVDSCQANYDNCTAYAYQTDEGEAWTYYPAAECNATYLVSGSDPVEDSAFTSSGYYSKPGDLSHAAKWARLTTVPDYRDKHRTGDVSVGSWVANNTAGDNWIQVELKQDEVIKAVATRGRPQTDPMSWVKTYNVSVSTDGTNWAQVLAENGQANFVGNTEQFNVVISALETPTVARFVRIYPTQWNKWISMGFDVRGCSHATAEL